MRGLLVFAFAIAGCATLALQTDNFPARLQQGCDTLARCELLVADARARVASCQPNTIGYVRCSDAQGDLIRAEALRDQKRQEADTAEQARKERSREEEAARQRERDKQRADEEAAQEQAATEERSRRETEMAAEQARSDMEQQAQADAETAKEKERLRLLGRDGRRKELEGCYRVAKSDCRPVLERLLAAAENEAERKALVTEDQKFAQKAETEEADTGGSLDVVVCCDGSYSHTCSCGSSRRGCCSHHGGVCGCK